MRVSDIRHPQAKIWVSLSLRKIHRAEQKCSLTEKLGVAGEEGSDGFQI